MFLHAGWFKRRLFVDLNMAAALFGQIFVKQSESESPGRVVAVVFVTYIRSEVLSLILSLTHSMYVLCPGS